MYLVFRADELADDVAIEDIEIEGWFSVRQFRVYTHVFSTHFAGVTGGVCVWECVMLCLFITKTCFIVCAP